jgi:hypothetical protein
LPAIGAAAGAAYGYHTVFTYGGETFEGSENAALWAGVGLVSGLVLNRMFFPKQSRSSSSVRLVSKRRVAQELESGNGGDYMIRDQPASNSLILVPRSSVLSIRQEYRSLERDLAQAQPPTSYRELQEWRRKLSEEYSILPAPEVAEIEKFDFRE